METRLTERDKRATGEYRRRQTYACRLRSLLGDRDDIVVKAMCWALRELISKTTNAIGEYLDKQADVVHSRVA